MRSVKAFTVEEIKEMIETQLGGNIEELFAEFSKKPLATTVTSQFSISEDSLHSKVLIANKNPSSVFPSLATAKNASISLIQRSATIARDICLRVMLLMSPLTVSSYHLSKIVLLLNTDGSKPVFSNLTYFTICFLSAVPSRKASLDEIEIEVPKNKENGDFSSNIAMKLCKKLGKKYPKIDIYNIQEFKDNIFNTYSSIVSKILS